MRNQVRLIGPGWIIYFCILSGLPGFIAPPSLFAGPPNVVLSRPIHFSTINGNPVTLSSGKYLIEQAGPQELRVTAVEDKQEFLIQAQALTHEQYELFSPMALTRYSKNHEFLINLFLPGGVRLEAKGSSKELPKPISGQGPPPITPIIETPISPSVTTPPDIVPEVTVSIPDQEPSTLPQTPPLSTPPPMLSSPPPLPGIIEEAPVITYQAPAPDQPGLRIDGESPDKQFPSIFVLAPNHVGHTSQEHPVLYWYLSRNTQNPLDVMIAEEGTREVLLDIRLLPPLQAGLHELRLEDYGINLLPDVPYRWTVRIINPQASGALTASGVIQRIKAPAGSSTSFVYSPEAYAQKGQWYDALTTLQALIHDNPGSTTLLTQRAALLKQVGLTEAAAFVQLVKTP